MPFENQAATLLKVRNNKLDESERLPLLARRGVCDEGADGVVD
jgi:hypothetical protein